MSVIKIHVNNEVATIMDGTTSEITSGDIGSLDIEFSFSSEWNGYKKTVLLYKGLYDANTATRILIAEDKLLGEDIPPQLFESPGFLSIGVFGDDDSGHRITTNIVTKRIDIGVPAIDTEEEVDYSLYNQIIRELLILERTTQEFDDKSASSIAEIDRLLSDAKEEIKEKYTDSISRMAEKYTDSAEGIQGKYDSVIAGLTQFKDEKIDEITIQVNGHIGNIGNVTNANMENLNNIANIAAQNLHNDTLAHQNALNDVANAGITNINNAKDAAITEIRNNASNYYTKAEIDALLANR